MLAARGSLIAFALCFGCALPGCALIDGLSGNEGPDSSPFGRATTFSSSLADPRKVAVGEFDGVPPDDVLVVDGSSRYEVWTGASPGGGFAIQGPMGPMFGPPQEIGMGDFNASGTAEVFIRTGDVVHIDSLGLITDCTFLGATTMLIDDIDGDGLVDIAVGANQPVSITIAYGTSDPNLGCGEPFLLDLGTVPRQLVAFDHDIDGDMDLGVLLDGSAGIQIMNNLADEARFRELVFAGIAEWTRGDPGEVATKLVVGDFDDDGRRDLAVSVASSRGDRIRIGRGIGNGEFDFAGGVDIAQGVVAGDMVSFGSSISDADNSLAAAHVPGNEEGVHLAIGLGNLDFDEGTVDDGFDGQPFALGAADLDFDGIDDLFGPVNPTRRIAFLFSSE